ncbi:Hypothetical protein Nlim_1996 [Candidatus Nitrosarchaeum limnium SFB1]|uniref:WavE lipopolysaccharide synthesis n=1 Tax=Candidatus Nitrosarchaeum limnium SFB1 TaxID=886738 RepID=F3KMV6_9ARCH|nr:Hypothetical protein Nlim_1996 [Candidatus Nitrosarchaeum limnium SFB1]
MTLDKTIGILLQGKISDWTKDIINEYKTNFPSAKILVSTWDNEDTSNLDCDVVKSELPELPKPHKSTVNFQIIGCNAGLKNLKTDIIMKCRTDQFIHNKQIFEIFNKSCSPTKIMIPDLGTPINIDYRTSDFCQIGYRSVLLDFWSSIPLYDGTHYEEAATYLTKHYVLNIKNDDQSWNISLQKYFCIKSFHDDFQIEWQKLNEFDKYKNIYDIGFQNRKNSTFTP